MIRLASAAALACCLATPVVAQEPAPAATTRCGGVLCDLYYANRPPPAPGQPEAPDPTHLPCHDFLCAAFGGRTPDAPPPAEPVAAPAPVPTPTKSAHRKHKAHKAVAAADTKGESAPEAAK